MKRLSVLIALMVCMIIGGVYAVWTYAGTNDIADAFAEAKVTIADAELTGANGTYKIESNLVLTVDQKNSDHEAELVFSSNDGNPIHLIVTFTPAIHASQDIKDNGVLSELYYGVSTPMQYKIDADGNYSETVVTPTDIFTFANSGDGELNNTLTWTKQADGTFTYSLNEDQLKEAIELSQTFVLDTKAEHDAFRTALAGNIVVRVTDGTVN